MNLTLEHVDEVTKKETVIDAPPVDLEGIPEPVPVQDVKTERTRAFQTKFETFEEYGDTTLYPSVIIFFFNFFIYLSEFEKIPLLQYEN